MNRKYTNIQNYLPMHFKHHNGSLIDFNSRTDVENSLLTDWISNERRDISLEPYKINITNKSL